jgi:putative DNA primase/helicase
MTGQFDAAQAYNALQLIDPGCSRNDWIKVLAAAKAAGLDVADAIAWSSTAPNFKNERDVVSAWRSINIDGPVKAGTLFHVALANGWKPDVKQAAPIRKAAPIGPKAEPFKHEVLSVFGLALWAECVPICGDGPLYLQARHCVIPPEGSHLRYHPSLRHPSSHSGPALVALVTDALTGEAISLHRTWIKADGTKADIDPPRMLLGGHRKAGGVVRLWPDECVSHGLAICEGIETCLSLAHAYAPVWSCIDAGNLAAFPVLAGVESLVIGADNDPAGQKAAHACATRWADADREVLVTRQSANDLNDVVKEAAHA